MIVYNHTNYLQHIKQHLLCDIYCFPLITFLYNIDRKELGRIRTIQ